MHVNVVGNLASRELEHRRPEQRMKINDVLADEVDLLHVVRREEFLEAAHLAIRPCLAAVEVLFERC